MKKLGILLLLAAPFILQYCTSSKKAAKAPVLVSYTARVQPIILANCSPCHIPAKGGRVKAYDSYLAAKNDIDKILDRVNRNPDQKGFMPFKHSKLADSTINVLVQWKKDGLLEN